MNTIRLMNDDLVPLLRDAGISEILETWITKNAPEDVLTWILSNWSGYDLSSLQIRQLIADLKEAGALPRATISGDSLPDPIERLSVPTGVGIAAGGNVWCTPPEGSYTIRFYVNGVLKTTLNDYYITSLESIGAVPGDVVQLCFVSPEAGIVGWWAQKVVP